MKKTLFTFLLLSLLHTARVFAGTNTIEFPVTTTDPTDTVPYVINEEELMSYHDSLSFFPAYDLYNSWDTENIHYKKFDINSLKDSIKEIKLTDMNSCGYVQPFIGKVTCPFGQRRRYFHYGTDIDLNTGDKVVAAFDGKVRIAKKSKSYGNVVVIRHANGLETYYAHLSKINVEVGQEVQAGEMLGLGGNTGRSHGSHLHFEVRYLGQPINPADIISFSEDKLLCDTYCLSKKSFDYVAQAKKTSTYSRSTGGVYSAGVYTVKKGDTLSKIASRYGTSTKVLCQKNGLKTTTVLRLGQRIKI